MLLDAFESLCHIYLHCNNLCLIELHHVVKLEPSRIFYNDLLPIVLNQPICSMHATANEEAWILAGEPVCQWLTGAKTWDATASKNNRNLSKLTLIHFQWKHLLLQSIRMKNEKIIHQLQMYWFADKGNPVPILHQPKVVWRIRARPIPRIGVRPPGQT